MRVISVIISFILITAGLAALALAAVWCWAAFHVINKIQDLAHAALDVALAAACSTILLWLASRNLKRTFAGPEDRR